MSRACSARTTAGRTPSCRSRIQASKKAPPGPETERVDGVQSRTRAVVRGAGGTAAVRISATVADRASAIGLGRPVQSNRPSVYSSSGKSARERSTSWEHHQVTPHRRAQPAAFRRVARAKSGAWAAGMCGSGAPWAVVQGRGVCPLPRGGAGESRGAPTSARRSPILAAWGGSINHAVECWLIHPCRGGGGPVSARRPVPRPVSEGAGTSPRVLPRCGRSVPGRRSPAGRRAGRRGRTGSR